MKKGLSLVELATMVEKKAAQNVDFLVDTNSQDFRMNDNGTSFRFENRHLDSDIAPLAHVQVGQRLGIPKIYYDKMRTEHPALLATNVNYLFKAKPEKRLVRTNDFGTRAFLSDRYRRIDHLDLLRHGVLPVLLGGSQSDELEVVSSQVTDSRMYLKVASRRVTGEITKGDIVQAGFVLSNSETGLGSVSISPFITRLVCMNGMISDSVLRKYHTGKNVDTDGFTESTFSDTTLKLDDAAFMSKVRDMVKTAIDETAFQRVLVGFRDAQGIAVEAPRPAIEELGKSFSLTESETSMVYDFFLKDEHQNGATWFGVVNAVTRSSAEITDYDRATELERLGGQLLAMPHNKVDNILRAA